VPSQKNAKLVRLRGATAVGYWVDRATASAASYAIAMRRRATSQRRFCRREGGLSLRRSLHWPALVEIKDGRRAAATPARVSLTQHADTRAKLSPPGPSSSAHAPRSVYLRPHPRPRRMHSRALSTYTSRARAHDRVRVALFVGRLVTFPHTVKSLDTAATLDSAANQMGGLQPTLASALHHQNLQC